MTNAKYQSEAQKMITEGNITFTLTIHLAKSL